MNTELDLAVAQLMGWNQVSENTWRNQTGDFYQAQDWIVDEGNRKFEPSRCENCAGLVLDRICALGWASTVFTGGWGGKTLIRCCIMHSPNGPAVDVQAETRPLAICRAFIQAMERWDDGQ